MRDRPAFDLFLISWVVLFLELACIRWFPSHVLFLTFFTNTVLLACFVGMSIGCLIARRPVSLIRTTPFFLVIGIIAGILTNEYSDKLLVLFAVGNQANPDVVFFGTEQAAVHKPSFTIPIEVVGAFFFVLIAGIMVGPGQEMGRAFNRVSDRTTSYSANLLGSLVGIGMFALCSFLRMPPLLWFALIGIVIAYLLLRSDPNTPATEPAQKPKSLIGLACLVVAVGLTSMTSGLTKTTDDIETIWSPYYRIDYLQKYRFINTNLISQQLMEPVGSMTVAPYALPYLFQRDLKTQEGTPAWPPFKRVLIIGAGSGNDVARALEWLPPDAEIDAVEIDPVIQKLGSEHHPDKPFADKRVHVYLNDGRNFLRRSAPEQYDLVLFALIDSLVLQSGYSNLRLESYLFTLESFKDVRRVLKPTGVYVVYNFFRQGFIACRIRDQLRSAFGDVDPVVMTAPPRADIPIGLFEAQGFTTFFAGSKETLAPIRTAFANPAVRYWYPWKTSAPPGTPAKFSVDPPAQPASLTIQKDLHGKVVTPEWMGMQIAIPDEPNGLRQATDNWPFLYSREASIPGLTIRGVVLTLVLSVILWFVFMGHKALGSGAGERPQWGLMWRSFFLGAGFMLVETKAIVEMALLFGGTWMVNTVVFAAILVMSLLGNLYAGKVQPKRLEPYYLGLFIALGIGLAIPLNVFLGLDPTLQIIAVCALVFTPVAFAGVVFATTFRRTSQPDRVFGMNVAGALCGGLAENASILLGFQLLLCVAVGFYLCSALAGNQKFPASEAEKSV